MNKQSQVAASLAKEKSAADYGRMERRVNDETTIMKKLMLCALVYA